MLVAACGSSEGNSAPDGPSSDGGGEPVTITIETGIVPSLVMFRDGAGTWETPSATGTATFEAVVHGPYVVTTVCFSDEFSTQTRLYQVSRTPDDDRVVRTVCDEPPAPRYHVTGTMKQAGSVNLGIFGSDTGNAADWPFDITVGAGSYRPVGKTDTRVTVRPTLAVAGDTVLTPPIDLAQEGGDLVTVALSVPNAGGETLYHGVSLDRTSITSDSGIAAVKVVPDSVLAPADQQLVGVFSYVGSNMVPQRTMQRPFRASDSTVFMLPDPVGDIQCSTTPRVSVTWSSVPAFDILELGATTPDTSPRWHHYHTTSASYLTATGATSIAIETDLPGFDPAWGFDATQRFSCRLTASRAQPNGESDSARRQIEMNP